MSKHYEYHSRAHPGIVACPGITQCCLPRHYNCPTMKLKHIFSLIICRFYPSLQDKMGCQGELAAHFQRHLPSSRSSVAACSDPKIMLCQKAVVHQEGLNGTLELLLHAGAPNPCRSVAQIIDKLHGFACLVSVFSSIRASELLCKRNLGNSVAGYYVQF